MSALERCDHDKALIKSTFALHLHLPFTCHGHLPVVQATGLHRIRVSYILQVAQLSQRDRATGWVSNGQKWKTGTERQYLRTI